MRLAGTNTTPACFARGFLLFGPVFFQGISMHTFDKLIATIHPHQWMVGLRSSIGAAAFAQDINR
jgi:hypothetical protein